MQIQLNEAELEVAVTLYLNAQGMNLKNKSLDFNFEGECTMDIKADDSVDTPKPKRTRKKAAPKKAEKGPDPVVAKEPEVAVEEVVEALEEQTKPVSKDQEDLFPEADTKVEEEAPKNDNSIFS